MLNRAKPSYFGAGPAVLPTGVLQQAAQDLVTYLDNGIGVGEISHRSKDSLDIVNNTKKQLTEILDIPETHEVFFIQGGGTTGFSVVATNLMAHHVAKTGKVGKAAYAVTGTWSKKSFEEAQRLGIEAVKVCDGLNGDGKFGGIADFATWKTVDAQETAYVYYCDNETVNGIEFNKSEAKEFPFDKYKGIEVVADMSSNFMSKKVDVSKFGLIFAGAQKNVGIAGITVCIIKKALLETASVDELKRLHVPITPIAFDFATVVKNNSLYNTIPLFTLHVLNLVLQNFLKKGTLATQEAENVQKASSLYKILDENPQLFSLPVAKDSRSRMNVVFTIKNDKESDFLQQAEAAGLSGLKGHRSVGGIRASLYNAIDYETVAKLVSFVAKFVQQN